MWATLAALVVCKHAVVLGSRRLDELQREFFQSLASLESWAGSRHPTKPVPAYPHSSVLDRLMHGDGSLLLTAIGRGGVTLSHESQLLASNLVRLERPSSSPVVTV